MSHSLKRGETVSLNALVSRTAPVKHVPSNSERVVKQNDLSALHVLLRVKGVR